MGVVYRAWNEKLGRTVALKTISADAGPAADEAARRFEREAQAIARLRHPSIVAVHEVGRADGRSYLAMDLIEGATLEHRLKARGKTGDRIPLTEGIAVIRDVARAVHHAHDEGVVHRDLKPANVMIDRDGKPVVLDFGLATVRGAAGLTRSGAALGTPAYMSPEQADGGRGGVDARTDVWSLGAILYHLLAGRPPFEGQTEANVIFGVLTKDPVPPGAINRRAAGDLETICLHCLEKEPERRYPSAAALAEDLERWLAGDPIAARPLGPASRIARRMRRNKLLTAIVAVALVGFVLLGGLAARSIAAGRAAEQEREAAKRQSARDQVEAERARAEAETARADAQAARAEAEQAAAKAAEARTFTHLAERFTRDGWLRGAAVLSAEAIRRDDESASRARFIHAIARSGPWRKPRALPIAGSRAMRVAWSPSGRFIAYCGEGGKGAVLEATEPGNDQTAWTPALDLKATKDPTGKPIPGGYGVAFTEGDILATVTARQLRIIDVPARRTLHEIDLRGATVQSVAWQPAKGQQRAVAMGTRNGVTALWSWGDPRIQLIEDREAVWTYTAAWSPDGRRVATGGTDQKIKIRDLTTSDPPTILEGHGGVVSHVAWSPSWGRPRPWGDTDDRLAAAADGGGVRLWHFGPTVTTHASLNLELGIHYRSDLAWDPSARYVAASSGPNSTIAIWDVETDRAWRITDGGPSNGLAWGPDGRQLAVGGSGVVTIWSILPDRDDSLVRSFRAMKTSLAGVTYLADRSAIVTASREGRDTREGGRISLFDDHGAPKGNLGPIPRSAKTLVPSPDGTALALVGGIYPRNDLANGQPGDDGTVLVFDLTREGARPTLIFNPPRTGDRRPGLSAAAWAPDGRRLATADVYADAGSVRVHIWDARETRLLSTITLKDASNSYLGIPHALAWSPGDGRFIAAGTPTEIFLFEPGSTEPAWRKKVSPMVSSLAFSPDGTILAATGFGRMELRDVATGELLAGEELRGVPGTRVGRPNAATAWTPDGRLIAWGTDRFVVLCEVDRSTGAPRLKRLTALELHAELADVAWTPEEALVVGTRSGIVMVVEVRRILDLDITLEAAQEATGLDLTTLVDPRELGRPGKHGR